MRIVPIRISLVSPSGSESSLRARMSFSFPKSSNTVVKFSHWFNKLAADSFKMVSMAYSRHANWLKKGMVHIQSPSHMSYPRPAGTSYINLLCTIIITIYQHNFVMSTEASADDTLNPTAIDHKSSYLLKSSLSALRSSFSRSFCWVIIFFCWRSSLLPTNVSSLVNWWSGIGKLLSMYSFLLLSLFSSWSKFCLTLQQMNYRYIAQYSKTCNGNQKWRNLNVKCFKLYNLILYEMPGRIMLTVFLKLDIKL